MTPLHQKIHEVIPGLEGWVSPERGCEMADLILELNTNTCIEIGVFGGRSLISQALALQQLGAGRIYGIDPWKVGPTLEGENDANQKWWSSIDLHSIHKGTMEAIWRLDLDNFVTVIRATSENAAAAVVGKCDMLLIDGNHSEVSSVRDVSIWSPRVRSGGIVYFDDTDWPSTQKALAILGESCDLIKDAGTYRIYRKK